MSVLTQYSLDREKSRYDLDIVSSNLNLKFTDSKIAYDNFNKISTHLSKIIDGTLPLNNVNKDLLIKAIQTFKYSDYKRIKEFFLHLNIHF